LDWCDAAALLAFAAERTAIRTGVEGLAAVPAEARLGRLARFQPQMDVLRDAVADERLGRLRGR
jgi:hypothetical protein